MSILQHSLQTIFMSAILVGPFPFCVLVGESISDQEQFTLPQRALTILTSWLIAQTVISLTLGSLNILRLNVVLAVEISLFISSLFIWVVYKHYNTSRRSNATFRITTPLSLADRIILLLCAALGLVFVYLVATRVSQTFDALAYHLPPIAEWYRTGSFSMPDLFRFLHNLITEHKFGWIELMGAESTRYTYDWEALCTLFTLPYKNDFLVAFPNLVVCTVLGLAIYSISRTRGSLRTNSLAAMLMALSIPIIRIDHINAIMVDLPVAAFFTASLAFVDLYYYTRQPLYAILLVPSLAMLVGVKTSGIAYALIVIGYTVYVILSIRTNNHNCGTKSSSRHHIFFTASALVVSCLIGCFLGGYWYIRNMKEIGNPLGYIRVSIDGLTLFNGPMLPSQLARTTMASLFNPLRLDHWKIISQAVFTQFGFPFLITFLITLLSLISLFRKNSVVGTRNVIVVFCLTLGAGILYILTPYSGDDGTRNWQLTPWIGQALRYAISFTSLMAVTSAVGMTSLGLSSWMTVLLSLIAVGSSLDDADSAKLYLFALGLSIVVFSTITFIKYKMNQVGRQWCIPFRLFLTVTILCFAILISYYAQVDRAKNRIATYGGLGEYISSNLPPNTLIGFTLSYRSYLFSGEDLQYQVLYTPSMTNRLSDWVTMLHKRDVNFLAIGPLRTEWLSNSEVAWLEDPNGPFKRIFGPDPRKLSFPALYKLK